MKLTTSFFILFILMTGAMKSIAQAYYSQHSRPLATIPYYTSLYPATAGLVNHNYIQNLIGTWVSDDRQQMIKISQPSGASLSFDLYGLNATGNLYEYSYSRYAPYATVSGEFDFFDWDVAMDNDGNKKGTSRYVTYNYSADAHGLTLLPLEQNYIYAQSTSSSDYRDKIAATTGAFVTSYHYSRYTPPVNQTVQPSNDNTLSNTAVGAIAVVAVAGFLDWMFGGSSSSSSSSGYSNGNSNNYSPGCLSPLGYDRDYHAIYDYNKTSEIWYNTDGSIKY